MNIILVSSTRFGAQCLNELLSSGHTVSAVITTDRNIEISYSVNAITICTYYDFKDICSHHNISLMYVKRDIMDLKERIEGLKPDIIIVAGWYYMVPKPIRLIPKFGCAGFHASLLPKYAGGAPVNWAIINGENETGITFFILDTGVDTGNIIDQRKTNIGIKDTCKTVYDRLNDIACNILKEKLPLLENGLLKLREQDNSKQTIMPQRKPEDGMINWDKSSLEIYNLIRAVTKPYPGAFTFYKERKLAIWEGKMYDSTSEDKDSGKVIDIVPNGHPQGILVSTGERNMQLLLTRISLNGDEEDSPIVCAEKLGIKPGDRLGK